MKSVNRLKIAVGNKNYAFYTGILLNFSFVIAEVFAGLYIDSLTLLTDAVFNLTNVAAIIISLLAYSLKNKDSEDVHTYGYQKITIYVALSNAVILLISLGSILYETIHRFRNAEPVHGEFISVVGAAGLLVNTVSVLLFSRNKEKDINVKSALKHLASDAMVSLAVVGGGITIYYRSWYFLDAVLSILIGTASVIQTWLLLKNSIRLSLYGLPGQVDSNAVKAIMNNTRDVINVHHIHIWGMSTSMNALTAHVVVKDGLGNAEIEKVKQTIKAGLKHANIQHATLEFESLSSICR